MKAADGIQTAVFAGGCFWGVQGVFQHTEGVVNAVSGYAGGSKMTANYTWWHRHDRPCRVGRDHVRPEADQLRQDPADLLLGRPRPDPAQPPGPGHRHAVSLGDLHRQRRAEECREGLHRPAQRRQGLQEADRDQSRPLQAFYPAEAYHQDYLTLHPNQPYIVFNDMPKVENLKKIFAENYIEKPTLVSNAKATN